MENRPRRRNRTLFLAEKSRRVAYSSLVHVLRRFRCKPEFAPAKTDQAVVDRFHRFYFRTLHIDHIEDTWLGVKIMKYPGDLMVCHELLWELKPDSVVETDTHAGGAALLSASILDMIGKGQVISPDINKLSDWKHERIRFLTGNSTSPSSVARVARAARESRTVLLALDSQHAKKHVLREMKEYAPFVIVGSYLVVEFKKPNGHPVYTDFAPDIGEGPMEAAKELLSSRHDFIADRTRERCLSTSQPGGFLKRVACSKHPGKHTARLARS